MQSWELIARESIRDIVVRYNSNGDSGRIDAMMKLFAPDATLEVPGHSLLVGLEAIRDFFAGVFEPGETAFELKSLHHHTATHQVDLLDEQHAAGRCYFTVYTQIGLDHWGRYIDEYRQSDGVWKFQSRRVCVDGFSPGGWGESQLSAPAVP